MDFLPLDCVSKILSHTSPPDACRFSMVSSTMRSAADSDLLWRTFFPSDYRHILSRALYPHTLNSSSYKHLFYSLCHPLLLDGGNMSFKLDKSSADPELPGHLLLEQYQAQLVSAVRTTLDTSSSPSLLEAGLHLATKILTSGIISGDQVVVKRIFSLISRPLNDFEDIYYPSFAEWVTSKIKIRLLAAHASLKCYMYASMRKHRDGVPDKYLSLLPLFQKSSSIMGKYWIHTLKDYIYICLCLSPKRKARSIHNSVMELRNICNHP